MREKLHTLATDGSFFFPASWLPRVQDGGGLASIYPARNLHAFLRDQQL